MNGIDDKTSFSDRELAATFRKFLDQYARRHSLSNDAKEQLDEELAASLIGVPRDDHVFGVLERAIGKNAKRAEASIFLYAALCQIPACHQRILERIGDSSYDVRAMVVQLIGQEKWAHLAHLLNPLMIGDPDPRIVDLAIYSAGELQSPVNLPVLLELASRDMLEASEFRSRLLWALREFREPAAEAYFRANMMPREEFNRPFDRRKEHAILAAWALLKIGPDDEASRLLIRMLDDPPTKYSWPGGGGSDGGVSLRAAQALCDIYALRFNWSTKYLPRIRQSLRDLGLHVPLEFPKERHITLGHPAALS